MRRLLRVVRLPRVVFVRIIRIIRSRVTRILGSHVGVSRAVGGGMGCRFCGTRVRVMMIRVAGMFVGGIMITSIGIVSSVGVIAGSLGVVNGVFARGSRVRGVRSIGVSLWVSIVMVIDVWSSSCRSCGSGCRRSSSRWWRFYWTVIRYFRPLSARLRA